MKLFMNIQSGISFKNPDPFSPRKDPKSNHKLHQNRGFSGPILPEARRNNKFDDDNAKEPISPEISCMGQIKHKKKMIIKKKIKTIPLHKQENPFSREHPGSGFWTSRRTVQDSGRPIINETEEKGKRRRRHNSQIMFGSMVKSTVREPDVSGESGDSGGVPPCLGQLKKFESGHDTLKKIDWATAQDESRREYEEAIIPSSAPILIDRVKPIIQLGQKKEINLWKRRTMAQPQPLHLK